MRDHDDMDDRRLIRYLHGELDAREARELAAQLERDPALRARLERLRVVWEALRPVPPTPVPYGFAQRLQRQIEAQRATGGAFGWSVAPAWVRVVAGAALVAGVALGLGLGRVPPPVVAAASSSARQVAAATPRPPVASGSPAPSPATAPAAPAVVAGRREESAPLTGEATFAEEYLQALAGDEDAGDGAG